MKHGLIGKILDYYFSRDKYKRELDRATREFFSLSEDSVIFSIDEAAAPFFNEWFVYDFKLKNGKRVIEDYCDLNPYKFNMIELAECRYLLKNVYGFLKILKVDLGARLEVEDIASGETYYVREVSGTYQLQPEYVIISRIAKIGDHYELVSADGPLLGKINGLEMFKDRPTPKDAYFLLHGRTKRKEEEAISAEEAETQLKKILEKSILGKHVTFDTIKYWMKNLPDKKDSPAIIKVLGIIGSLLYCREKPEKKYSNEIIKLIQIIHNNTPQKSLGGKSPEQMRQNPPPDYEPDISLSKTPIGGEQCENLADEFMRLMQQRLMKKAVKKADEFFHQALKDYYVGPEIFRYYANVATCYFYLQDYPRAWEVLDISLALNPNYDFGLDLRKKFKSTKKLKIADRGDVKESPARKYYDFLLGLKINFATEKITKSKRFNI
jgi:hypothetical protein